MDKHMNIMSAVWRATTGRQSPGVKCFTGTIIGLFIKLEQFTDAEDDV